MLLAPARRVELCWSQVDTNRLGPGALQCCRHEGCSAAEFENVRTVHVAECTHIVVSDAEQPPSDSLSLPHSESITICVLSIDTSPQFAVYSRSVRHEKMPLSLGLAEPLLLARQVLDGRHRL